MARSQLPNMLFTALFMLAILPLTNAQWQRFGDYEYIASGNPGNWFQARDICAVNDAAMVTITSQAQNDWIAANIATDGNGPFTTWIGLTKDDQGNFRWEGSSVQYNPDTALWADGEPTDEVDNDCVWMDASANHQWDDQSCFDAQRYVCQRVAEGVVVGTTCSPALVAPANGRVIFDRSNAQGSADNSLGVVAIFTCDGGFDLTAGENILLSFRVTCQSGGWNFAAPTCVRQASATGDCGPLTAPVNGQIISVSVNGAACDTCTGASQVFICDEEFSLNGIPTLGAVSLTCLSNDQWDAPVPTCVGTTITLDLGIVRLSGSFLTGSCQALPDRVSVQNQIRQQIVDMLDDPQITVTVTVTIGPCATINTNSKMSVQQIGSYSITVDITMSVNSAFASVQKESSVRSVITQLTNAQSTLYFTIVNTIGVQYDVSTGVVILRAPVLIVCGNGILETGEECDDGNTEDGDGCTNVCSLENTLGRCDCTTPFAVDYTIPDWMRPKPPMKPNCVEASLTPLSNGGVEMCVSISTPFVNGGFWSIGSSRLLPGISSIPSDIPEESALSVYRQATIDGSYDPFTPVINNNDLYGPCFMTNLYGTPGSNDWTLTVDGCEQTRTLCFDPLADPLPLGCVRDEQPTEVNIRCNVYIDLIRTRDLVGNGDFTVPTSNFLVWGNHIGLVGRVTMGATVTVDVTFVIPVMSVAVLETGQLLISLDLDFGNSGFTMDPSNQPTIIGATVADFQLTVLDTDSMELASTGIDEIYNSEIRINVPVIDTNNGNVESFVTIVIQPEAKNAAVDAQTEGITPSALVLASATDSITDAQLRDEVGNGDTLIIVIPSLPSVSIQDLTVDLRRIEDGSTIALIESGTVVSDARYETTIITDQGFLQGYNAETGFSLIPAVEFGGAYSIDIELLYSIPVRIQAKMQTQAESGDTELNQNKIVKMFQRINIRVGDDNQHHTSRDNESGGVTATVQRGALLNVGIIVIIVVVCIMVLIVVLGAVGLVALGRSRNRSQQSIPTHIDGIRTELPTHQNPLQHFDSIIVQEMTTIKKKELELQL